VQISQTVKNQFQIRRQEMMKQHNVATTVCTSVGRYLILKDEYDANLSIRIPGSIAIPI